VWSIRITGQRNHSEYPHRFLVAVSWISRMNYRCERPSHPDSSPELDSSTIPSGRDQIGVGQLVGRMADS